MATDSTLPLLFDVNVTSYVTISSRVILVGPLAEILYVLGFVTVKL